MDNTMEQFSDHMNVILSDLRLHAVEAITNSDLSLHNMCLYRLSVLVSFPEVCSVLVKTQRLITENLNSNTLGLAFRSDYLSPFFDLHPADIKVGFHLVQPDISSVGGINSMRSQYQSLMDGRMTANVRMDEVNGC